MSFLKISVLLVFTCTSQQLWLAERLTDKPCAVAIWHFRNVGHTGGWLVAVVRETLSMLII